MARRSTTNSSVKTDTKATTASAVVADVDEETVEKNNEEKKTVTKKIVDEPLSDSDEIEVVSIIPNVSYKDDKTGDMYEWDEVGHVEYMTVDSLKTMWRNHKSYFKNLWLKPNDNRVLKLFGLVSTYEKYEFLMDESNYTRNNVDSIVETLSSASTANGLKLSVCLKIRDAVKNGIISDVFVIKTLEKRLNLDLISFL